MAYRTSTGFETKNLRVELLTDGLVRVLNMRNGEFVEVSQEGREGGGKIAIASVEWPALRDAIYELVAARCDHVEDALTLVSPESQRSLEAVSAPMNC